MKIIHESLNILYPILNFCIKSFLFCFQLSVLCIQYWIFCIQFLILVFNSKVFVYNMKSHFPKGISIFESFQKVRFPNPTMQYRYEARGLAKFFFFSQMEIVGTFWKVALHIYYKWTYVNVFLNISSNVFLNISSNVFLNVFCCQCLN